MRRLDFGDDDEAVREVEALHLEWDDAIGQLPKIVEAYEHGHLSDETVAEMHRVAREIDALVPEMKRIQFPLPAPDALARALQDAPARTA
jgi:hypothetical protein